MTRSRRFTHINLSSARWLLPWIVVLSVSVTLAFAMGSGMHGGASITDQWEAQAAPSTSEDGGATLLEQSTTSLSDTAMGLSGGTFGVMSRTSPASTGHASASGCCTWN
jgi:hypothetical protein